MPHSLHYHNITKKERYYKAHEFLTFFTKTLLVLASVIALFFLVWLFSSFAISVVTSLSQGI